MVFECIMGVFYLCILTYFIVHNYPSKKKYSQISHDHITPSIKKDERPSIVCVSSDGILLPGIKSAKLKSKQKVRVIVRKETNAERIRREEEEDEEEYWRSYRFINGD
jgi:ribosomal protein L15E